MAIGGTHTLNPSLVHECAPGGRGRQITGSAQQFAGQPDCTTARLPACLKKIITVRMLINTIPFLRMK